MSAPSWARSSGGGGGGGGGGTRGGTPKSQAKPPGDPPQGDAEMPATEKDLAEDAPWKRIQQNTFTRWCNEHLKGVHKRMQLENVSVALDFLERENIKLVSIGKGG
uniref:Calponin-homology (CH) domain-containing protein n=1 Tax=Anas zonorhyncha TaxID=75864 RepID=A0A8B9ZUM9_9AVES